MRIRAGASLLMLAMLVAAETVNAQGWAPALIGARVGYDNRLRSGIVGAQIHIPVVRSGLVEILPNADVTFQPFKEYQFNLEAVYVLGDQTGGGLYAGGGVGFRSLVFSGPREIHPTLSLVGGLKLGGLGRVVPQVEFRWLFVDDLLIDPQQVTLGVSIGLWERPRPGL